MGVGRPDITVLPLLNTFLDQYGFQKGVHQAFLPSGKID